MNQCETALSQWALGQVGFSYEGYFHRLDSLAPYMHRVCDPETLGWSQWAREVLWADYYGKELELFKKCAEVISDNRDRLWEIAEKHTIIESRLFIILFQNSSVFDASGNREPRPMTAMGSFS